jgi:predicted nucleic acid-binding protein
LLEYLLRTELAESLEQIIRTPDADLHVPALCDVELAAGLRRGMLRGAVSDERVVQAIEDYLDLPVTRHGHQGLLARILGLRENFSAYDATYIALTEQLGGELLTADERLTRAARIHTQLAIAAL